MTRVLREDLPSLPPELANLAGVASAADSQIAAGDELAPGAPGGEPEGVSRGEQFGAMLRLAVELLTPAMPFLPRSYTPEACAQIGVTFAGVADHYGWELAGVDHPLFALAVVTVPPTITAVMDGRAHFAALQAADERAQASTPRALASPQPVATIAPAPSYSPAHVAAS